MTTFSDLIEETRQTLMTGQGDHLNILDLDVTDSVTVIQFEHELVGVGPGARLGIGLEEMHVLSISGAQAGSQATVIRGFGGSTAAAHTAGDIIRVNPHFTNFRIAKHINQGLDDCSGYGLFQIKRLDFDFEPARSGYNITAPDLIDVWKVSYDYPGPSRDWPTISKDYWDIDFAPNAAEFPGVKLVISRGGSPGHKIHVTYKAGFTHLANLSDDVEDVAGLHPEAHDLPVLSAAIDLTMGREIKRTFLNRQPEPRRQQEVPPGSALQAMQAIVNVFEDKIAREKRRLSRRYPGAV